MSNGLLGLIGELRAAGVVLSIAACGALAAGVFRSQKVCGPARTLEGQSAMPLGIVLLLALICFFVVQGVIGELCLWQIRLERGPDAKVTSADFSAGDIALLNTMPGVVAIIALIAGDSLADRRWPAALGLSVGLARLRRGMVQGVVGTLIALPMVMGVGLLTEACYQLIGFEHPPEHELLRVMGESRNGLAAMAIVMGATIVAPLWEELFFRGHLQTLLVGRLAGRDAPVRPRHAWLGLVAASVAFGAVHEAWTAPPIIALSICLGYAYERTGNLWVPITMHLLFNAVQTAMFLQTRPIG
jgi:membrane protease YdiL (CAAX protease family)